MTQQSEASCTFGAVDAALDRLETAVPVAKKRFLDAAAHCVMADGRVTLAEGELLRGVADALGCPLPPFLPTLSEPAQSDAA